MVAKKVVSAQWLLIGSDSSDPWLEYRPACDLSLKCSLCFETIANQFWKLGSPIETKVSEKV